jgi:hypothetical protein
MADAPAAPVEARTPIDSASAMRAVASGGKTPLKADKGETYVRATVLPFAQGARRAQLIPRLAVSD